MAQKGLEQTMDLADWGFTHPSEIQYIAADLFNSKKGQELLIYDVRSSIPQEITSEKSYRDPISPVPKLSILPVLHKALWVWDSEQLLDSLEKQKQFIAFCKKEKITDIYFQIPYKTRKENQEYVQWNDTEIKNLIRKIHLANMKIHALDGDPKFALKQWHAQILHLVESIIEYNHAVPKIERFDGIHFDIEPYSLPDFFSKKEERILGEYLDLLKKTRVLTQNNHLVFGVDIPPWFDRTDDKLKPHAILEGRPMSEWILDTVDQVTLMDYRTRAEGPHGIIQEAMNEIKYAEKTGKKILIGLETQKTSDDISLFFIPTHLQGEKQSSPFPSQLILEQITPTKLKLLWLPFSNKIGFLPKEDTWHFIQIAQEITAANSLSFAGKTRRDLQEAMLKTAGAFMEFKSFGGFAIHSYESYQLWNKP